MTEIIIRTKDKLTEEEKNKIIRYTVKTLNQIFLIHVKEEPFISKYSTLNI